ncbi:MAG: dipeptide epimerase, partial [Planctomicrobium sp.]|nr:dipeptide epimerase [Planctomicrobium sp.]
ADQDLEIMQALRQETDAVLRVDANCAWTAEQTVEMSHALHELDIEFIEQPLPATASAADKEYVYKNSVLPVIADESCMHEDDVIRCVDRFHGINVKLSKCGGLTPAFRMLKKARELGLKTMAGCMIESDVAIGAALQLSPLLDFADLDGSVLLAEQPFTGVSIINGTMAKPIGVGTGVSAIAASTEVSNY